MKPTTITTRRTVANDEAEPPQVDLQVTCDAPGLPEERDVGHWIALAAAGSGREIPAGAEISVRIVDEVESQSINRQYRGKDRPTNVLAFPAELETLPGLPSVEHTALGDLVICAPIVSREAVAQGKTEAAHWAHLVVHGFLHLVGFDHESDAEAAEMEGLEVAILASMGLGNPYEDRHLT